MLTLSKPPPGPDRIARESDLLAEVSRLLRAGRADEAVEVIGLSYLPSPRVANALAVCHLRLGNTARALRLLRHIATDGAAFRPDVPVVFKTNLAAALLVAGDVTGCLRTLDEIVDEDTPAVRRLRAAAARAVPRTAWGRWLRRHGIGPSRPPEFDGPVGELSEGAGAPVWRDGPPIALPEATADGVTVRPSGRLAAAAVFPSSSGTVGRTAEMLPGSRSTITCRSV